MTFILISDLSAVECSPGEKKCSDGQCVDLLAKCGKY